MLSAEETPTQPGYSDRELAILLAHNSPDLDNDAACIEALIAAGRRASQFGGNWWTVKTLAKAIKAGILPEKPSAHPVRVKIEFQGQDFTWFLIEPEKDASRRGVIIDCGPFEQWYWVGKRVMLFNMVGQCMDVELDTGRRPLRYKTISVSKPEVAR